MEKKYEEFRTVSLADWRDPTQQKIKDIATEIKNKYDKVDTIYGPSIEVEYKLKSKQVTANLTPSTLSSFSNNDAFVILTKEPQYYIRFGALLNYIKDNIILKIKNPSKEGIFNINTDFRTQKMYSLPNRISLDPRVCIVRNSSIDIGSFQPDLTVPTASLFWETKLTFAADEDKTAQAFHTLEPFTDIDNNGTNINSAYSLNIYLNFNFILESLSPDDKGNISVYDLLSKICTGLNRALGGINNLEPIIDETSNTLQIIDTTPIPKTQKEPGYTLQIYGYDKGVNNYISNFVRKVDLKTAITPEFATMITVGATAGGYVKGVEATAFSKWNTGLTDRFKKDLLPPKGDKLSLDDDEATSNYEDAFRDHTRRYGITSLGSFNSGESITNINFSNNLIEKNISVMTEYYKYLVATTTRGKSTSGGTVGFIPFKLSLTMDGISGIKIYDVLHVNTKFLPKAYGTTVDLIVTGISHRLANNDWETSIEATVMPKTSEFKSSKINSPKPLSNTTVTFKKGSKNPDKLCGLASANNVNTVYPKSVKWQGGNVPVIVQVTNTPGVVINLSSQPVVKYSKTIVTAKQYIQAAEKIIDQLAPSALKNHKKQVLISAFSISKAEQGYGDGFKGFNNNISGVESSGFSVYNKSDVIGKVSLTEGGTGKKKYYYAFSSLSAGLVPLISKIMDRNMFATGGTPNEFAWRYFRDWNGYGARTTKKYKTDPTQDDCDIIASNESIYKNTLSIVNSYSKYK